MAVDERDVLWLTMAVLALGVCSVLDARMLRLAHQRCAALEEDVAFLRSTMKVIEESAP